MDLFAAIDLFEVKRSNNVISVRIAKVGGKKLKPKTPLSDPIDDDGIPF